MIEENYQTKKSQSKNHINNNNVNKQNIKSISQNQASNKRKSMTIKNDQNNLYNKEKNLLIEINQKDDQKNSLQTANCNLEILNKDRRASKNKIKNIGAIKKVPPEIIEVQSHCNDYSKEKQFMSEKELIQQNKPQFIEQFHQQQKCQNNKDNIINSQCKEKIKKQIKKVTYHQQKETSLKNIQNQDQFVIENNNYNQSKSQKSIHQLSDNEGQKEFTKSRKILQQHTEKLKKKIQSLEKDKNEKSMKYIKKSTKQLENTQSLEASLKDIQSKKQKTEDKNQFNQQMNSFFECQECCDNYLSQIYQNITMNQLWTAEKYEIINEQSQSASQICQKQETQEKDQENLSIKYIGETKQSKKSIQKQSKINSQENLQKIKEIKANIQEINQNFKDQTQIQDKNLNLIKKSHRQEEQVKQQQIFNEKTQIPQQKNSEKQFQKIEYSAQSKKAHLSNDNLFNQEKISKDQKSQYVQQCSKTSQEIVFNVQVNGKQLKQFKEQHQDIGIKTIDNNIYQLEEENKQQIKKIESQQLKHQMQQYSQEHAVLNTQQKQSTEQVKQIEKNEKEKQPIFILENQKIQNQQEDYHQKSKLHHIQNEKVQVKQEKEEKVEQDKELDQKEYSSKSIKSIERNQNQSKNKIEQQHQQFKQQINEKFQIDQYSLKNNTNQKQQTKNYLSNAKITIKSIFNKVAIRLNEQSQKNMTNKEEYTIQQQQKALQIQQQQVQTTEKDLNSQKKQQLIQKAIQISYEEKKQLQLSDKGYEKQLIQLENNETNKIQDQKVQQQNQLNKVQFLFQQEKLQEIQKNKQSKFQNNEYQNQQKQDKIQLINFNFVEINQKYLNQQAVDQNVSQNKFDEFQEQQLKKKIDQQNEQIYQLKIQKKETVQINQNYSHDQSHCSSNSNRQLLSNQQSRQIIAKLDEEEDQNKNYSSSNRKDQKREKQKIKFHVAKKDFTIHKQFKNQEKQIKFNKNNEKIKKISINKKTFLNNQKMKTNQDKSKYQLQFKNSQKINSHDIFSKFEEKTEMNDKAFPRDPKAKAIKTQESQYNNIINPQFRQQIYYSNNVVVKRQFSPYNLKKATIPINKIIKNSQKQNENFNGNLFKNFNRQIRIVKKSPYGIIQFILIKNKDNRRSNKVKNARIVKGNQAKQLNIRIHNMERIKSSVQLAEMSHLSNRQNKTSENSRKTEKNIHDHPVVQIRDTFTPLKNRRQY